MPTPAEQHYRDRLQTVSAQQHQASISSRKLLLLLLSSLALILATFAIHRWHLPFPLYPAAIAGVLAAYLLPRLLKTRYTQAYRLTRLQEHLEAALARCPGQPPDIPRTGEEFRDPTHLYDRDLEILGPNSLFCLLATVRTHLAERHLALTLLNLPTHEQSIARQKTIQLLTPATDLRERIALLGSTPIQQIPATLFDTWLDEPPIEVHLAIVPILHITAALLLLIALAFGLHLILWATVVLNVAAILAIQGAIVLSIRSRIHPVLERAGRLAGPAALLRQALSLLQSEDLPDPILLHLKSQATTPTDAIALLKKLETPLTLLEQRTKEWFYALSLAFSVGTKAILSIETWKRLHAADLRRWLDTWAEFETLNALATYAFEHPSSAGHTYPEILPPNHPATFEAVGLAHPLLPPSAIRNTIALNPTQRFYLISGSNMAGKSTLLRAVGLNTVLAALGAPIRATSARLSTLQIGASLAITDSLADGKSKFLAEVERLTQIITLTQSPIPTLFLIDEIFSGTNSLDRRTAAQAILTQLTRNHAIGALSTHDLTLTELAGLPDLHGINLHMASPDPADPLAFDYLLKPGINQTSNALAIVRMMGLEI